MAFSTNIVDLINQDPDSRDDEWEKAFLAAFPHAQLNILNEAPHGGPDGWPYLLTEISSSGGEPVNKVLSWLSDKGIGLVVNPNKDVPDYVFSYGMVWNFREKGEFLSANSEAFMGQVKFDEGRKVLAGPPSDKYLPEYARLILRSFFRDNGIEKMNILVMSQDQKQFDLCFSLETLGNPPAHEHKGLLEALSWFLPAHYSLMVVSEQGLPQFHPL